MPTYVCWTTAGSLNDQQRARIAESITAIHAQEGRAPRYFVQVVFNELQPNSHFVGGLPAFSGQIWIRADIRSGRSDDQKRAILNRIAADVSTIAGVASTEVWVYISDIPAAGVLEFGQVLPQPGQEEEWFAQLPDTLKKRLSALA